MVIVPVEAAQAGCIIELTVGVGGIGGCALIITSAEGKEEHPPSFVTVKLYVPANRFGIVTVLVFPIIPPGLMIQFLRGKSDKIMLPVASSQDGCVIVLTMGVSGVI